jgi:hypothetical protein
LPDKVWLMADHRASNRWKSKKKVQFTQWFYLR